MEVENEQTEAQGQAADVRYAKAEQTVFQGKVDKLRATRQAVVNRANDVMGKWDVKIAKAALRLAKFERDNAPLLGIAVAVDGPEGKLIIECSQLPPDSVCEELQGAGFEQSASNPFYYSSAYSDDRSGLVSAIALDNPGLIVKASGCGLLIKAADEAADEDDWHDGPPDDYVDQPATGDASISETE